MLNFVRQMRDTFRGITPDKIAEQGNFLLTVIIIRSMAAKLNMTTDLAAEIVGAMTIQVDNDTYHQEPELFNETAEAMVDVMVAMYQAYAKAFDHKTAFAMVESSAKGMSLTYG